MQQLNNGIIHPVSKQRTGKQAYTPIELLLETVFSILPVQNGYKKRDLGQPI
jgi:hypothetical protein